MTKQKQITENFQDKVLLQKTSKYFSNIENLHELLSFFIISINHKIENIKEIQKKVNYQIILLGIISTGLTSLHITSLFIYNSQILIWCLGILGGVIYFVATIYFYINITKIEPISEQAIDIRILKSYISKDIALNKTGHFDDPSHIIHANTLVTEYKEKFENINTIYHNAKSDSRSISKYFIYAISFFVISVVLAMNIISPLNHFFNLETPVKSSAIYNKNSLE